MKDEPKAAEVGNFRQIVCFKLLACIIEEQVYAHLNQNGLLPVEQKGCKGSVVH